MALTYPVKIEFKEYPSGSWQDWSEYLARPPLIKTKVESENEGEAGVIVFDTATVSFRYNSGTLVYTAFTADLTSVQRYLFRISFPKSDKSYVQRFEGMADFATLKWNEHNNIVSFAVVDKLTALGVLDASLIRERHSFLDRINSININAAQIRFDGSTDPNYPQVTDVYITLRDSDGVLLNNMGKVLFPGEILHLDIIEPQYAMVLESTVDNSAGHYWNHVKLLTPIEFFAGFYPIGIASGSFDYVGYSDKEFYGIDILNYVGGEPVSIDGIELMRLIVKSQWSDVTFIKKPETLSFAMPLEYSNKLLESNPLGETPLEALKTLADSLDCWIYFNRQGYLVLQSRTDSLSTSGVVRALGNTKIISKLRHYFWDKIVDGVIVTVNSWVKDEEGNYLTGIGAKTLGNSKPKNEIKKKLLVDNSEITNQEDLNSFAEQRALDILNFYGRRRESYDLVLDLDDNTIEWELVDKINLGSGNSFFTSITFDGAARTATLEPVELSSHPYDLRQIVVALSEANAVGSGFGGTTVINNAAGTGGTSYMFDVPLVVNNGIVSIQYTGNLKLTGNNLDTIQNIKTTDTPTFNQLLLSTQATLTTQAVRADRTVSAAAPLTGGGDLSANRSFGLGFNAVNLKLTANALNTIQDIAVISSPTFNNLNLSGLLTVSGAGNNYIQGNVGVGVTATEKLDVNGNILSAGNVHVSGGDRTIFNRSNNYLALGTNNTERLRITNAGLVGINVTPNVTLEVGGNIHLSGGDRTIYNRSNNYLALGTNNTERIRILNTGEVGINKNIPVEKLHLVGHFKQEGNYSIYNNFTSGWTGSGWRIDYGVTASNFSTLELDNLWVRGSMVVFELIINQIRATNGSLFVTSSARVEWANHPGINPPDVIISFEDPEGHNVCPFFVDDIILIQRVRLDSTTVVKRVALRVTNVANNVVEADYLFQGLLGTDEVEEGDVCVRIGNYTNANRRGALYLTSDDSNAPYMDVVDDVASWTDWGSSSKLKARLGKLTGITDNVFGSLSGYGLYSKRIYLSSNNTTGIKLFADDNTAQLEFRQSGLSKLSYDTATGRFKLGSNLTADSTTSFDFTASTGALRLGFLTASKSNLYFDGTNLKLRINTSDRIVLDPVADLITVGSVSSFHTLLDSASLKIKSSSTVLADFGASVLIGQIGAGQSNVFITSGQVKLRNNVTDYISLDTSGNVLIGRTGAGQSNVYISSGNVRLRNNITDVITLNSDGSGTFLGDITSFATITGGVIRTAASGQRIVLNESSSNSIKFYTSTGKLLTLVPYDQGSIAGLYIGQGGITSQFSNFTLNIDYALAGFYESIVGGLKQTLIRGEKINIQNTADNTSIDLHSDGTISGLGDIKLDPASDFIYPVTNYDINLGKIDRKFLTLYAAELRVETLVSQNTIATIGGRILVAKSNVLTQNMNTVTISLHVKYNNFSNGDRIYLENGGNVEFMAVTSGPIPETGGYLYSVTRNLDGSGANQWYAGDAVVSTGQTGSGFMDIYSIQSIQGSSQQGPTIVGNIRNSSTYNDWSEAWAIGNLGGLYGQSSGTFGAGFGKYKENHSFMLIDNANGIQIKRRLPGDPATDSTIAKWDMDGTITIGNPVRIQLNPNGSGILANGNISWNTAGVLTAGGWTIDSKSIVGDGPINIGLFAEAEGSFFQVGDAIYADNEPSGEGVYIGVDFVNSEAAFFIGDSGSNLLSYSQSMGLIVKGNITAYAGQFLGQVTVGSAASKIIINPTGVDTTTAIYSKQASFGSPNNGFWLDASGRFGLGSKLTWDGTNLTLTGGIFAGSITSTATITGGTLQTSASAQRIVISGADNNIKLYNSNGSLTGEIVATTSGGGSFDGIKIISSGYLQLGAPTGLDLDTTNIYTDGNLFLDLTDIGGKLYFGSLADTNLYRGGANILKTDDGLHIKQPSNTAWGSGLRLLNASTDANYWDFIQGSTNQLIFGYQGVTRFSVLSTGTLDLSSTTAALIVPRLTTTQRDNLSGITNGMVIYNTSLNKFQGREAGAWANLV